MIIREINKTELGYSVRQSLGLPTSNSFLDDSFIASCIRRIAGFQCPCSAATLISMILKSLKHLGDSPEVDFKLRIEDIMDRLIIGGDLLELSEVSTNDLGIKSTWIFSAHPSYLLRPNGTILIFGIVPDENSPIASLSERIIYEDCKRYLIQKDGEDLGQTLKELGLMNISESAWLKLPKINRAVDYLSLMNSRLSTASVSGEIPELMVLNTAKKNTYYRGRWTNQIGLTGNFVGKRPHLYGINIWCYVELSEGKLIKFIDIPFKLNGITQRGCDGGWHLQMAIDYCASVPQVYNIRSSPDGEIFDFYSPLPLWAERRFIALGRTVEAIGCLFSYLIPKQDCQTEEAFLKEYLWLSRKL